MPPAGGRVGSICPVGTRCRFSPRQSHGPRSGLGHSGISRAIDCYPRGVARRRLDIGGAVWAQTLVLKQSFRSKPRPRAGVSLFWKRLLPRCLHRLLGCAHAADDQPLPICLHPCVCEFAPESRAAVRAVAIVVDVFGCIVHDHGLPLSPLRAGFHSKQGQPTKSSCQSFTYDSTSPVLTKRQ